LGLRVEGRLVGVWMAILYSWRAGEKIAVCVEWRRRLYTRRGRFRDRGEDTVSTFDPWFRVRGGLN